MKIDIMTVRIEPWIDNQPDVIRAEVRIRCGDRVSQMTRILDKNEYFITNFHIFMRIAEEEITREILKEPK